MLKKIITLLAILLVLIGCSSKKEETTSKEEVKHSFSILCPNGGPALSLIDLIGVEGYELDFVDGADVLQAEFSKGEKDFIIAPINLGYKLSSQTGNYELNGIVTWNNLYIIGKDDSININGKIAAFGEAAIPGKIVDLVSMLTGISLDITWFPSVAEAATAFLSGKFDYAVVAEPYLTNLQFQSGDFKVLASVADLYKEVSGMDSFPQAGLFVKKSLVDANDPKIDELTKIISDSINTYTSDPGKLDDKLANTDLSVMGFNNKKIILDCYSTLGLKYVNKKDCENEIAYLLKLFGIDYK